MISNYENKEGKLKHVKVKLNADLRGLKTGAEVKVRTDKYGTPVDRYWRDRFNDAKKDNCLEIVKQQKPKKEEKKIKVKED